MQLTVDWFKQEAVAKTGLADYGADYFETTLAAFVEDLNCGHLTEVGTGLFTRQMVNDLVRRLQVIDYMQRFPEIDDVEIPPILYVSGLERTGTTLLHNLLNLDQQARAFKRWELMYPVPAPEAATWGSDPRICKVQSSIERLRGTKLEHMHWVEATDPEECYWGLLNGFGILGGSAFTIMPRFMAARTPEATYQALLEYRSIIKILLWKNPLPEDSHLVLKSPQFCGTLSVLKRALPECRMIITHRDPYRALVSVCNLQAHIHEPFVASGGLRDRYGPITKPLVDQCPRRLMDIGHYEDSGHLLANVSYPRLVAEPAAVVEQIYSEHGFNMPAVLPAAIHDYIAAQKAGKRARPADIDNFGLRAEKLFAQPTVQSYCQRYGVQREVERITG